MGCYTLDLQAIIDLWKVDSPLDLTDLANESSNVAKLHCKYYEIYLAENLKYQQYQHDYHRKLKLKTQYYMGKLSKQEMADLDLEPLQHRVTDKNVDLYLDSDDELIKTLTKIGYQKEKVEFLKDIIKSIHSRNFTIKSAIDFIKWSNGS